MGLALRKTQVAGRRLTLGPPLPWGAPALSPSHLCPARRLLFPALLYTSPLARSPRPAIPCLQTVGRGARGAFQGFEGDSDELKYDFLCGTSPHPARLPGATDAPHPSGGTTGWRPPNVTPGVQRSALTVRGSKFIAAGVAQSLCAETSPAVWLMPGPCAGGLATPSCSRPFLRFPK